MGDAMHEEFIRDHIARLSRGEQVDLQQLIARVANQCWPGGASDRTEPAALRWVSRWRPMRALAPLPVCSCRAGHCPVCN